MSGRVHRRLSRLTAAVTVATVVGAGCVLTAGSAAADTEPPVPNTPVTVSSDALPTVQINGVVWAQVVVGNTVYATGKFTSARPAGAAAGSNETPRSNLLAYDITTGELKTGFAPTLNAQGLALAASADGQTIFVGGDFTQINGQNKYRLAALDATTGAVKPNLTVGVDARVRALAVVGNTLYLGGIFSTVANQPRTRLAAVNWTNSQLQPWAPSADAEVSTLAAHASGSKVFIGGKFGNVNGSANKGLAVVDATSGASYAFPVNSIIRNGSTSSGIYGLRVAGDVVYGAGWNFGGGGNFESLFAADVNTLQLIYASGCRGDTYDTLPMADTVYVVAHAHKCSALGGFPEQGTTTQQRSLAFRLAPVPGKVNASGDFMPGQPAPELLHWYPSLEFGTYTGQDQAAWSLAGNDQYVAVGGEFPRANGIGQQGLTRYAVRAIAPNQDGPQGYPTLTPTLTGLGAGVVRAGFTAAFDQDNTRLTYALMRGASFESATVVASTTADTNFWTRPTLALTDASAPPGSSQTYRIRVTDPRGNTLVSEPATTTVPAGTLSPYHAAVAQDGAVDHWTLNEPSGVARDWRAGRDLTLPGSAARNQPSLLAGQSTDPAVRFPGNANATTAGPAAPAPQTFTVEAWFTAVAATRGKLIGFGDRASGNSTAQDRNLYLNPAGNLVFSVRPTTTPIALTSPATYKDGAPHHVVATYTAHDMKLYVDGQQVAARTDVPDAVALNGWWRVGGDAVTGLPTPPASGSWNSVLDEVAVYPTALSAQAILRHYDLGRGNQVNEPPTASFTAVPSGLDVAVNAAASTDPDGTVDTYAWDFGDGQTGTGVTTQHSYPADGTYTITLTVTDNGGATASTTRQVTVADTPAGPVTVAADAFNRTLASGWGSADTGGAWSHSGSGTTPSVADGTGRLTLAVGRTGQLRLAAVAEQNVDLTTTTWVEAMPTGGGVYLADSVRVGGGNEYRGRIRILADGSVQISITKVDGGAETTLASSVTVAGLTYTAGTRLNLRTEAVGANPTTVRTKVWPVGTTEPASWQRTATDSTASLQQPGAVGFYGYLSGSATAGVTVRADDVAGHRPAAP